MSTNSNWYQDDQGWHKIDDSQTNGNADYFKQDPPPVRDAETGHPIGPDGNVDWARVIREANDPQGRST